MTQEEDRTIFYDNKQRVTQNQREREDGAKIFGLLESPL